MNKTVRKCIEWVAPSQEIVMRQKVKLGPGKIGQKRKALYDEKLRQKGVDFSKLVVELLERELEVQKKGNGLHSRSPLRR